MLLGEEEEVVEMELLGTSGGHEEHGGYGDDERQRQQLGPYGTEEKNRRIVLSQGCMQASWWRGVLCVHARRPRAWSTGARRTTTAGGLGLYYSSRPGEVSTG
mgnify:CR=1 FL=1